MRRLLGVAINALLLLLLLQRGDDNVVEASFLFFPLSTTTTTTTTRNNSIIYHTRRSSYTTAAANPKKKSVARRTNSQEEVLKCSYYYGGRTTTHLCYSKNQREEEIRRKIIQLKKEGRLKKQQQQLGLEQDDGGADEGDGSKNLEVANTDRVTRQVLNELKTKGNSVAAEYEAQIRAKLSKSPLKEEEEEKEEEDEGVEEEESEADMVQKVMQGLAETQFNPNEDPLPPPAPPIININNQPKPSITKERQEKQKKQEISATTSSTETKKGDDHGVEYYEPKTGSWGKFPRPKNISKAYGGGKRIGAGYTKETEFDSSKTRELLRRYKEKFGIEVQSEKDNAEAIEQALERSAQAMRRGAYQVSVSALEQVSGYCSSNSPTGGKVYLELAMSYEALGRTKEAIQIYQTLKGSRIDTIKNDAKRLLYNINAMKFMREDLKMSEFQKKKIRDSYVDTSVLSRLSDYDDKPYNTAWVDTSSNGWLYKRLTESVVRSTREARTILLKATYSDCDIPRPRVVQALRSISREFDVELKGEKEANKAPTAMIDGKPIIVEQIIPDKEPGSFMLLKPEDMIDNLDGEWRLQLLADKTGDGVKYFNTTIAWQTIDCSNQKFEVFIPSGFTTMQRTGDWNFENEQRLLKKSNEKSEGWSFFSNSSTTLKSQQILLVDSIMCITRLITDEKTRKDDSKNIKDYFAVWRRVDSGTYSSSRR